MVAVRLRSDFASQRGHWFSCHTACVPRTRCNTPRQLTAVSEKNVPDWIGMCWELGCLLCLQASLDNVQWVGWPGCTVLTQEPFTFSVCLLLCTGFHLRFSALMMTHSQSVLGSSPSIDHLESHSSSQMKPVVSLNICAVSLKFHGMKKTKGSLWCVFGPHVGILLTCFRVCSTNTAALSRIRWQTLKA